MNNDKKYRVFSNIDEGVTEIYSHARIGEIAYIADSTIAEFDADGEFVAAYDGRGQVQQITAKEALRNCLRELSWSLSELRAIYKAGAVDYLSQYDNRVDGFVEWDGSNFKVYEFGDDWTEITDEATLATIAEAIENREGGNESCGIVTYSNVFEFDGDDCVLESSRFSDAHELYSIVPAREQA